MKLRVLNVENLWPDYFVAFGALASQGINLRDVDAVMVHCDRLEEQGVPGAAEVRKQYRERKEKGLVCKLDRWEWV